MSFSFFEEKRRSSTSDFRASYRFLMSFSFLERCLYETTSDIRLSLTLLLFRNSYRPIQIVSGTIYFSRPPFFGGDHFPLSLATAKSCVMFLIHANWKAGHAETPAFLRAQFWLNEHRFHCIVYNANPFKFSCLPHVLGLTICRFVISALRRL